MRGITYQEPAFLKDIHRNQVANYNKTKLLTVQERISEIIRQSQQDVGKIGIKSVETSQKQ